MCGCTIYSGCEIKQWLPPEQNTDVRRCRYDSHERLVSTCPHKYKDWKISHLCESAPASFVYEGGELEDQLHGRDWLFTTWMTPYESDDLKIHTLGRKFRNSYCASCNAAGWIGCKVKKSFERWYYYHAENTVSNYIRYYESVPPYMFVFQTDLNRRTCKFNSDGFITSSNYYESGLDTCNNIEQLIQSCAYDSVLDFTTQACVKSGQGVLESQANSWNYSTHSVPSNYKKQICKSPAMCLGQNNLSSNAKMYYNMVSGQPIDRCNTVAPIGCHIADKETVCLKEFPYAGMKASSPATRWSPPKISLFNSVPISYLPVDHDISLAQSHVEVKAGLDLLFDSSFVDSERMCSQFSKVNNSLSSFLFCRNGSLLHIPTKKVFSDFLLQHNEIKVCVGFVKVVFKLDIYHYIFSALSAVCLLVYIVWYIKRPRKTLTGNFFVCQMATLMAALLCYCFIVEAKVSPIVCRLVTYAVQYLFLSVHCWTNVLAIWMFRSLSHRVRHQHSDRRLFVMYAAYGWVIPLLFVLLSFTLNAFPVGGLYPVFSKSFCFLAGGWIRVLVFSGPIYVQIAMDVCLCICASIFICRVGKGDLKNRRSKSKIKRVKSKIISVVRLLIIFGLQWLLLFFTEIDTLDMQHFWRVLNILITLQGVFIILAQLLNRHNIVIFSNKVASLCGIQKRFSHTTSNGQESSFITSEV